MASTYSFNIGINSQSSIPHAQEEFQIPLILETLELNPLFLHYFGNSVHKDESEGGWSGGKL